MAIWQDIWQLGQKVLALTKTTLSFINHNYYIFILLNIS